MPMSNKIVHLTWIIPSMLMVFTTKAKQPNIIYLMLDEWGYFESGHMGSSELITPNIDQFAADGMRFTNAYAGAPVCGPTRCSLLTGLHAGNMSMRVNNGHSPIRADEPTVASMLKAKGYATGGFGKWGIGGRGTTGVPEKHGFDEFFGYYDQVHAHTFYPSYLIRNSEEVPLPGNSGKSFYEGKTHAQLEIFKESIAFIQKHKEEPFFCYLPWTPPHGLWGIDKDDPSWKLFKDKPWTAGQRTNNDAKIYAAFMHMVDQQLGEIIKLLKKLKLDENTIFFLSGDNGGQAYFATKDRPHGFFAPNLNPETGKDFVRAKATSMRAGSRFHTLYVGQGKLNEARYLITYFIIPMLCLPLLNLQMLNAQKPMVFLFYRRFLAGENRKTIHTCTGNSGNKGHFEKAIGKHTAIKRETGNFMICRLILKSKWIWLIKKERYFRI